MYKIVLAAYFVFWSVYWPVGEEILNGWRFYTHYTFYVATICERPSMPFSIHA